MLRHAPTPYKFPRAIFRGMILLCRSMLCRSNCWLLVHAVVWQNHAMVWWSWFVKRDFYYFWKIGFRTPIVTLFLCHYKKKVVAILEEYLHQQSRIEFRFLIFLFFSLVFNFIFTKFINYNFGRIVIKLKNCWRVYSTAEKFSSSLLSRPDSKRPTRGNHRVSLSGS